MEIDRLARETGSTRCSASKKDSLSLHPAALQGQTTGWDADMPVPSCAGDPVSYLKLVVGIGSDYPNDHNGLPTSLVGPVVEYSQKQLFEAAWVGSSQEILPPVLLDFQI